jgi:hypothetical protein
MIYVSHIGKLDPTVGSSTMLSLGIALENQLDGGF